MRYWLDYRIGGPRTSWEAKILAVSIVLLSFMGLKVEEALAEEPSISAVAIADATRGINSERISSQTDHNWLSYGRDYHEQRFSRLSQVNDGNVDRLGMAWYFDTNYSRGLEATPIIVDGVMFVTGNWSEVYALNAITGELIWHYDPKVPKQWGKMACCDVVNRGVALYQGKVFVGTLDARLVALEASTGRVLWDVKTADTSEYPYTITGAPRAAKGKVFIGNGGAEFGARGFVSAYDVDSGDLVWRFFTVPRNPEDEQENEILVKAAETWTGQWWKNGGGGTVWDSIVYDPELDQLYIGVGNGSPWNRRIRSPDGGDNLFLSSIVALDPDTGAYIWHFQETPKETWDYTATQPIMLADMNWQGKVRKVIWHAPKNGFFFIIDREDGQLLSAEPFSKVNWASHYNLATGRPVENPGMDYSAEGKYVSPSPYGAHSWHPMSYHPDTGLVYIPTMEIEYFFEENTNDHKWGQWNTNTNYATDVMGSDQEDQRVIREVTNGFLTAWNPHEQNYAWRVERELAWNGGTLATAGNLVFQGRGDGQFEALDAITGASLWSYKTNAGVIGSPVTYMVDGEQYIAIPVGWGGILALTYGLELLNGYEPPPSRILAFKIGGQQLLPPLKQASPRPEPPVRITDDAEIIEHGAKLYAEYCGRCHGQFVVSNGRLPDLRRRPKQTYAAFDTVVLEGGLAALGMPGFKDVLSREDAHALKAYLIDAANDDWEQKGVTGVLVENK
jgi:PQQ-dependent dehydrogenase (methanol/ethanol family)